jgi:hypothetical protein
MSTGVAVREWAPALAEDPRVLDTALDILAEQAREAERREGRRGGR